MSGPLQGVKVVELGVWVAAPAAASILADWGADVVKIEAPAGDPLRAASAAVLPPGAGSNPHFEPDNRGKRSVALDLRSADGLAAMLALLDSADVFVTNVRAAGLARLGLDPDAVRARNPRLVYALITGYGLTGPDSGAGAFDLGAFWARGGVAHLLTVPGEAPPIQRQAMGDHQTGLAAAAMISAALFDRERTGAGQVVSTSLLRVAAYHVAADLHVKLMLGTEPDYPDRRALSNPLWNNYAASDGRRLWLINPAPGRAWPILAELVDRVEWLDDPRYATQQARADNCRALITELDEIFARRSFDEWARLLDTKPDLLWAPVNTLDDILADPQTAAAGTFVDVEEHRQIATPADFHGTPCPAPTGAPGLGEHTDKVVAALAELPGAWPARG
ncbi:CaiB/BaiF CoA transferase family protein [Amycolatopsis sp. NPDC005003]